MDGKRLIFLCKYWEYHVGRKWEHGGFLKDSR